ncbi:hypothetical protein LOY38_29110 [Pseudomonas sp. B21-015]|uniref:hypothetical protein n=1 Tax=Pseudomonas sp. B21-015 TaxID=2895473 RepID=UPI002160CBB1|nr:hypothetical protein [Pseudomonas sp. B21-015]UVM50331.1 hypothetical protein LOY38_29110 [Pseudomonas sp. B21-015]
MMNNSLPAVTRRKNEKGQVEYHIGFASDWEGFDSLVKYLEKYWHAVPIQKDDNVYSRRWLLRSGGVSIAIYHDSQIGNYFVREDGVNEQALLEQIEADLIERFR